MSNIAISTYDAGDPIIAADINADFTAIQTGTAALTDINTRSEWCSRRHIDEPSSVLTFNRNFNQIENGADTQVVISTAFIQVLLGATAFRFTPTAPIVLEPGQVLRAHFDINVNNTTIIINNQPTVNIPENEDCYQFAFFINNGAGTSRLGCISTYSTTITPHHDSGDFDVSDQAEFRQRKRQRCNLTLVHINTSGVNETFNFIEARVRVVNNAYTTNISLREGTMTVFTGRF